MPEVSIITPAYNAQTHIETAIKSALNQTIQSIEVIVVDDGSNDSTAEIVSRLDDPRVRLIRQDNQGQSAAINTGVEQSSGAYIKLLDADDWINPEHLEAQLKSIGNAQDCLASCRWGYFVEDCLKPAVRQEFTNHDYEEPLEWIIDSLTRDEGMMGGWKWLIPRSVWDKSGGFDPRLSLNNDFHFSISLLLASDGVRFAEDAVYSYRKGITGALSGSSGRLAMESAFLTTELGTNLLLESEDSLRIRKICADRFQQWLFRFYPQYPELVLKTEQRIKDLGGSDLALQGGIILRILRPLLGWKGVRQIQRVAYSLGWQRVLEHKQKKRKAFLKREVTGS